MKAGVEVLFTWLLLQHLRWHRSTGSLKYVLMCVRLLQGPPSASHILTFLVQQEPYFGSNLTGFSERLNYISAVTFLSLIRGWYFSSGNNPSLHITVTCQGTKSRQVATCTVVTGKEHIPVAAEGGCRMLSYLYRFASDSSELYVLPRF